MYIYIYIHYFIYITVCNLLSNLLLFFTYNVLYLILSDVNKLVILSVLHWISNCNFCYIKGKLDAVDTGKAVEFVVACMNFDGGFGCVPGSESHSGQVCTLNGKHHC